MRIIVKAFIFSPHSESPWHLSTYPYSSSFPLSQPVFITNPPLLAIPHSFSLSLLSLSFSRSLSCVFMQPNVCNILLSIYRVCGVKCVCMCSMLDGVPTLYLCNWMHPCVHMCGLEFILVICAAVRKCSTRLLLGQNLTIRQSFRLHFHSSVNQSVLQIINHCKFYFLTYKRTQEVE